MLWASLASVSNDEAREQSLRSRAMTPADAVAAAASAATVTVAAATAVYTAATAAAASTAATTVATAAAVAVLPLPSLPSRGEPTSTSQPLHNTGRPNTPPYPRKPERVRPI